jgi:hypothetical protein
MTSKKTGKKIDLNITYKIGSEWKKQLFKKRGK